VAQRAASCLREPPPKALVTAILISYRLGANPRLCFEKYIDVSIQPLPSAVCMKLTDVLISQCILDLLIQGQSPGIKERLVDLYNKSEILFFGPDGAHTDVILSLWDSWYIFRGNGRYDGLGCTYVTLPFL
jgi:hypothetical protein